MRGGVVDSKTFNDMQRLAADAMLGAECAFCRGKKKEAAASAKTVLATPECAPYHTAAKAVLRRCSNEKRSKKERLVVSEAT